MEPNPKAPVLKLPSGKGIDLKKILRARVNSTLKEATSLEEEALNNEAIDALMKGVQQFSKAIKEAKIGKKNTYNTNKYVTGQLQDNAFERIRIDGGISTNEETLSVCKQLWAVVKLRYKYLFQHHQDCKFYQDFCFIIHYFNDKLLISSLFYEKFLHYFKRNFFIIYPL